MKLDVIAAPKLTPYAHIKTIAAFAKVITSPGFGQLVLSYARLRRLTRKDSPIHDPAVRVPAPPQGTASDLEIDAFAKQMGFALADVRLEAPSDGPLEGTVIQVLGPRPLPYVRTPAHEARVAASMKSIEVDEADFQRWLRAGDGVSGMQSQ